MGKLAEAFVEIKVDLATLRNDLEKVRQEIRKASEDGSKAFGAIGSGLRVGLGVLTLGAVKEVATGLFRAAKEAAGFEETMSKVRATFGSSAGDMIGQADDLAARYGSVKNEVLDASAAFGLMGIAAGLSKDRAAELGEEFVRLGLDIASYHDLTNQEAFGKLRAGLAGESEPLRPLGIMLSEASVKAEALAIGLSHGKRELTDQEKILARMSLIRRQAEPAVGDLERTKESTANMLKSFSGELKNAAVEFGEGLKGALVEGIKLAREIGSELAKLGVTPSSVGQAVGDYYKGWFRGMRGLIPGAEEGGGSYFGRIAKYPQAITGSVAKMAGMEVSAESVEKLWSEATGKSGSGAAVSPKGPDQWISFMKSRMAGGMIEAEERQRVRQEKALSDLVNPLVGAFESGARKLKDAIEAGMSEGEGGFIAMAREQRLTTASGQRVSGAVPVGMDLWRAMLGGGGLLRAGGGVLGEVANALARKPEEKRPFYSEVFEGHESYATRAIQAAYQRAAELREGADNQEKLLAVQEQAKDLLADVSKGIGVILDRGIKTMGGVRPL